MPGNALEHIKTYITSSRDPSVSLNTTRVPLLASVAVILVILLNGYTIDSFKNYLNGSVSSNPF